MAPAPRAPNDHPRPLRRASSYPGAAATPAPKTPPQRVAYAALRGRVLLRAFARRRRKRPVTGCFESDPKAAASAPEPDPGVFGAHGNSVESRDAPRRPVDGGGQRRGSEEAARRLRRQHPGGERRAAPRPPGQRSPGRTGAGGWVWIPLARRPGRAGILRPDRMLTRAPGPGAARFRASNRAPGRRRSVRGNRPCAAPGGAAPRRSRGRAP